MGPSHQIPSIVPSLLYTMLGDTSPNPEGQTWPDATPNLTPVMILRSAALSQLPLHEPLIKTHSTIINVCCVTSIYYNNWSYKMRTTQPGALLKRPQSAGITLIPSIQSRRLTEHLQDLIIIAYQRSTNLPGNSLSLIRSEYVSAVENEGKFSMRLNVLVKDHELNANVPLTVNFTVDSYQEIPEC